MIARNVEFSNIRALEADPSSGGYRLARFPETLRTKLSPRARLHGAGACGGEIRFVTDAPFFNVKLMARNSSTWPGTPVPQLCVMCGNLEHRRINLAPDTMHTLSFDAVHFNSVRPEVLRPLAGYGFAPEVWRFVLPACEIFFGGIETWSCPIRPPFDHEKPAMRCLCYGSSITQCSGPDGWPAQLGQLLGIEMWNLGLSGSCLLEPEIADFLAGSEERFDGIIFEPGMNLLEKITPGEFSRRVEYLLKTITQQHPDVPILMLDLFPHGGEANYRCDNNLQPESTGAFRQVLHCIVEQFRKRGLRISLAESAHLSPPALCWSTDLLHPRAMGNSMIAFSLAETLRRQWNLKPWYREEI